MLLNLIVLSENTTSHLAMPTVAFLQYIYVFMVIQVNSYFISEFLNRVFFLIRSPFRCLCLYKSRVLPARIKILTHLTEGLIVFLCGEAQTNNVLNGESFLCSYLLTTPTRICIPMYESPEGFYLSFVLKMSPCSRTFQDKFNSTVALPNDRRQIDNANIRVLTTKPFVDQSVYPKTIIKNCFMAATSRNTMLNVYKKLLMKRSILRFISWEWFLIILLLLLREYKSETQTVNDGTLC